MKHVKPGLRALMISAPYVLPAGLAPTDTAPTGDAPVTTAAVGGEGGTGGTAVATGRDADADLIIPPPAGATGGSGEVATGGGASAGAQQQQADVTGTGQAPAGKTPIESLPADVQQMINDLRRESGDNRIKAKTAVETAAAEAEATLKAKQEEWIGGLLKAAGLMPDVADQAAAQLTPEQQIEALTAQLGQRDQDVTAREQRYRDTAHELALWKGAAVHDADPQKLADSVSFMRTVAALDPDAADYPEQVSAAIATAVSSNEHFKRPVPVAAVTPPPAVASGADGFAGGPRGGTSDQPQGIEAHRAALRERRARP